MLNHKNLFFSLIVFFLVACADDSASALAQSGSEKTVTKTTMELNRNSAPKANIESQQLEQQKPENRQKQDTESIQSFWQTAPENWQSYDHQTWVQTLHLTETCRVNTEGNASRFLQSIQLNATTTLLLLACELGAYQDAYYGFLLQAKQKRFKPLVLDVPEDKNGAWSFVSGKLIWGSVWKEDNSEELDVTFLSAATGMCGHRSFYSVNELIHSESSEPSRAYADRDCYNGIRVEAWPKIK